MRSALTIFVTGTDTGVGKTRISSGVLQAARARGIQACGFKPVASGCRQTRTGLRNADALALQRAAGTDEPYERINPYAFKPAIAPHLAAREAGVRILRSRLDAVHRTLAARHELLIVEGAGGWQVPLDARSTLADWVESRQWPVLLVVGMRLGCISHALLAAESIARRAPLLGWVANRLPPAQPRLRQNIDDLCARMPVPLLGEVRPGQGPLPQLLQQVIDRARQPPTC